jgi:hypothetical protein
MTLDDAIGAVHDAEPGPQVVACIDYDGTLISGFSAGAFYRHRIRHMEIGPIELTRTLLATIRGIDSEESFGSFLDMSLQAWKGKTEEELLELGADLFKHDIGSRLHIEMWKIVQAHHDMGHTIALASSATRYQVEPMAREIGADHVRSTSWICRPRSAIPMAPRTYRCCGPSATRSASSPRTGCWPWRGTKAGRWCDASSAAGGPASPTLRARARSTVG